MQHHKQILTQASNARYAEMTERSHQHAMDLNLSLIPPPPPPAVVSPSSSSSAMSITASDGAMDVDVSDMDASTEQQQQRSQVRFCPDVRVRRHLHVTEMSDDEYFSSYYQQDDYRRIRIQYAIKKIRSMIRKKTSSTAGATPGTDEARQVQKLVRELKKLLLLHQQIEQNQAVVMENDSRSTTASTTT